MCPAPSPSPAELSAAAQDYLKAIWSAREWSTEKLGTKRLAELLGVSASTVSETVRRLAEQGFVDHRRYGEISLTPDGEHVAVEMVRRHRLIETFLVSTLGFGWDEVHDEAEVLEHAVSRRFVERLDRFLGHPGRDPHGDPIPTADGHLPDTDAVQLTALSAGERGVVERISDDDPELLRWCAQEGIAPGCAIAVTDRQDFMGVLTARIESGPGLRLGVAAGEAVWVRRA